MLQPLIAAELPCWVWWNGSLDESPELLEALAGAARRLVRRQLHRHAAALPGSAGGAHRTGPGGERPQLAAAAHLARVNSLAMVFDPPSRRDALDDAGGSFDLG
jgi:hypothetical protein